MQRKRFLLNYRCSCVLLFFLIYVNESIMFREQYSASLRGILTIAGMTAVYAVSFLGGERLEKRRLAVSKRALICYLLLMMCIGISIACNGIDVTTDVYGICLMTVALLAACMVEREMFYRAFASVMTFLAAASVIIFLGYHLLPKSLFSFFPNHYWHNGILIKNCGLTVLQVSVQNYRNFGIFYEPGYYAVFLIWALFLVLFKMEGPLWQAAILLTAVATTLSTGGYVAAAALAVIFVFRRGSFPVRIKKQIVWFIVLLFVGVVLFLLKNPSKLAFLTDKFSEISAGGAVNSRDTDSGYERWRAVVYAVEAFLENPVAGIGQTGWQTKFRSVIGTATPLNWFGLRGLLYGILMNYFYLKNAVIKTEGKPVRWLWSLALMAVLLWNISSQNMANDLFLFMLLFYEAERLTHEEACTGFQEEKAGIEKSNEDD